MVVSAVRVPVAWFAGHSQLDPALTEVVTLTADDVLLDRLLAGLAAVPGAQRLLLGASVYRSAVDEAALLFQVGAEDPAAEHIPDRRAAQQRITDILVAAGVSVDSPIDLSELSEPLKQHIAPYAGELYRLPTPPRRALDGLRRLVEICAASSLLTLNTSAGGSTVFVHRWTATELHHRWGDHGQHDQLTKAYRRAADYWLWRVRVWPQDRAQALEDMLEARHHFLAAGDPDTAAVLTGLICSRLHDWGAWDREEALIHDTIAHFPVSSPRLPAWLGRLGDIAVGRGRTGEAARRYAQSLAIRERLVELDPADTNFQRDLSVSYERLGRLDEAAGRSWDAQQRYSVAGGIRRGILRRESHRADLAEELSVTLRLIVKISGEPTQQREALGEIISVLTPFEDAGTITPKGATILGWAREMTG